MTNDASRDDWATRASGWVEHQAVFDHVFAPLTAGVLAAADLAGATRVLDVGCGAGSLLEAAVAAGSAAVGVDISPLMVAAARLRVPAATVVEADAQTADLLVLAPGAPFDRVVSRFGVMFFADPIAAFANIRSACAPGARLAFVCWQAGETHMFTLGLRAITRRMHMPPDLPVPNTPGPLGLADLERIHSVLGGAGWRDVAVTDSTTTFDYSINGSDGVEERLSIVLAGSVGQAARARLEPELGPVGWPILLDRARDELRKASTDGHLTAEARTWTVTATNPIVE